MRDLRLRSLLQRHQRQRAKMAAADVASTVKTTKRGTRGSSAGSVKVTLVKDSLILRPIRIRKYVI